MGQEKLSAREAALIAQARREAEARKAGAGATVGPHPASRETQQPNISDRPKASPAERLAQLMAEEHAETERRKKKMRRYGILVPGAILAVFALWLMRAFSRRR